MSYQQNPYEGMPGQSNYNPIGMSMGDGAGAGAGGASATYNPMNSTYQFGVGGTYPGYEEAIPGGLGGGLSGVHGITTAGVGSTGLVGNPFVVDDKNHLVPKVKILYKDFNTLKFELYNTDLTVANALRRVIISEVPTMAIDLVEISENTSALHDEFLAHRCGLIPLVSETVDEFNFKEQCPCQLGNCEKCTVTFELNVDSSKTTAKEYDVTTLDIYAKQNELVVPVQFVDGKTGKPQHPIQIMKLGKRQQLKFKLIACKGIGKQHAKWSPVATCIMHKQPLVTFNEDIVNREMTIQQREEFVSLCPRKVYHYNKMKQLVEIEDQDKCNLCIECLRYTDKLGHNKAVTLKENDSKFIFTIESTGALPPELIVKKALVILDSKINNFNEELLANNFEQDGRGEMHYN